MAKYSFLVGLDISHANGKILWDEVPDTYHFAFVKATQGRGFVDPRFLENRAMAQRSVIPYHFVDSSDPHQQADNFVKTANLKQGSPCMLDYEGNPHLPPIDVVDALINILTSQTGRKPVVYHGIYDLASKMVNTCPWHVPKWGPIPKAAIKWAFWQDTNKGVVPGVHGYVDHDYFHGTETDFDTWYTTGKLPSGLKSLPPKPVREKPSDLIT